MTKCDTSQENGIAVTSTHSHKMGSSPSSIEYIFNKVLQQERVRRPIVCQEKQHTVPLRGDPALHTTSLKLFANLKLLCICLQDDIMQLAVPHAGNLTGKHFPV